VKQVLRTDDRERVAAFIGEMYLPVGVDVSPGRKFEVVADAVHLETMTAGVISTNRDLRVYSADVAENFHINLPVRGRVLCSSDRNPPLVTTVGQASVFMPEEKPDTHWGTDTAQLCMMVPRSVVEDELEVFLGYRPHRLLRFGSVMELAQGERRAWYDLLSLLARDVTDRGTLSRQRVARRHFERLVIDGLLMLLEHNYTSILVDGYDTSVRGAVAKAVALIEESPADSWSSVALAARVHVSVRSLQAGFRQELDASPMDYVRTVRLSRARDDLKASQGSRSTVAEIAARWGFVHLGRFAANYRAAFGEMPSTTLRSGLK
jgi:AraC-like DNA-binding protein